MHPGPTLFPYTTLFRSGDHAGDILGALGAPERNVPDPALTRLALTEPFQRPPLLVDLLPHGRGVEAQDPAHSRSEEHTSELQSHSELVCRFLLEKNKHI